MANVTPANAAIFGLPNTFSATVQSKESSVKMDKKTARGLGGDEIAVAYYGQMAEHTITLLDTSVLAGYTLGVTATAPTDFPAVIAGTVFVVDEISVELNNEDFVSGSVKVSEYVISD